MPSLRRTASSPFVRSSPYSSALNGAQVARGQGQRRSSGSEMASRRVLADIEWWRVTDGQCDPSAADAEEEEHNPDGDVQNIVAGAIAGVPLLNADAGVDHPSTPSPSWPTAIPASWTESVLPTAEFAALAIAPQTPPPRNRELEPASSNSSLESTPEAPVFSFGGLPLEFPDIGLLLFEEPSPPSTVMESLRLTPSLSRTHAFSDCFSFQDDYSGCYFEASIPSMLAPSFVC